ncbi:MAG: glycosyltransferase family 4 protein [Actinomycetota bacterium]
MTFPKTLIVTNDFPPRIGGVERFVFDLAHRLPADRIKVIAPSHPGDREFDRGLEFPVERLERGRLLPPRHLRRRIREVITSDRPDVVLFGHALPLGMAGPMVASMGVPYAMLTHGAEYWLAKTPVLSTMFRWAVSRASRVFVISTYVERAVTRVVPDHVPIAKLTPGVDTTRFTPEIDGRWVREAYGIGDRPLILSVSRMVPRKGQDVLIDALPIVQRAVPDVALLLVGDGPGREKLEARVSACALSSSIRFAREVADADLPAFYAAADVFATPCRSRWGGLEVEGFGIVFLEAAAAGLASVAGDSGGAAEAVIDEETGLIVDGTDASSTAEALVRILSDDELADAMGRVARFRAVGEYDWHRIAARLGNHLAEVAEFRPAVPRAAA